MNRRQRLAGRLAVGLLLLVALFDPPLYWQRSPLDVIVLVDDSASMDPAFTDAAWPRLLHDWAVLPPGSRVAVLRFAADSGLELPPTAVAELPTGLPRVLPLDRSGSAIEAALDAGLHLADPRRPTALVLLSDGRETSGSAIAALQRAGTAGVPVYGLLPDPAPRPVAWIEASDWPASVPLGQRWPLTVTLAASQSGQGRLRWQLDGVPAGETVVRLTASETVTLTVWPTAQRVGVQSLTVSLEPAGGVLTERSGLINVTGLANVQYLTVAPAPVAAVSLQSGGWSVHIQSPADWLQAGAPGGVIILDDVAIHDLPDNGWQRLQQAVQAQGSGLIVLGGPRSFGAGGYRRSLLEALLPVTAEAPRPQPPATVLFVVDKSGSMDRAEAGISRLALARQAVVATARLLPDGDRVGLLLFDNEPHWLLPLASYPDPAGTLDQSWRGQAAGGTQPVPALWAALTALSSATSSPSSDPSTLPAQRLLILISDGLLPQDTATDLAGPLAAAGITVVALAIGETASPAVLQRLAQANGGRVLPVRDVALLPRLLAQAVSQQRAAPHDGPIQPEPVQPLAYPLPVPWPPLHGYCVTRARPQATVYLRAPVGDPLLAGWAAGAGRVVVLPGGLGNWAADWPAWPGWGMLLGGLVEQVNDAAAEPGLALQVDDPPGRLEVLLDVLTDDQDWQPVTPATLWVRDPTGQARTVTLPATAPGRYQTDWPITRTGHYHLTVQLGDRQVGHELFHTATTEFSASDRPRQDWQQQGNLQPWPGKTLAITVPPQPHSARTWLVTLALLVYLLLLIAEHGLLIRPSHPPFFTGH